MVMLLSLSYLPGEFCAKHTAPHLRQPMGFARCLLFQRLLPFLLLRRWRNFRSCDGVFTISMILFYIIFPGIHIAPALGGGHLGLEAQPRCSTGRKGTLQRLITEMPPIMQTRRYMAARCSDC